MQSSIQSRRVAELAHNAASQFTRRLFEPPEGAHQQVMSIGSGTLQWGIRDSLPHAERRIIHHHGLSMAGGSRGSSRPSQLPAQQSRAQIPPGQMSKVRTLLRVSPPSASV